MDSEQRDALGARNHRRAYGCQHCGSLNTEFLDGAKLTPEAHFAGVIYKVCRACGREDVKGHNRRTR
jgi:ribosomal protein L40E